MAEFRIEKDSMGEMQVPADAYYGAQTARAMENFPISSLRFSRRFIHALGLIKAAAARANLQLKLLDERRAKAIEQAALEVARGHASTSEFVVDVFQTGSGTSTNMNANEVIASRAIEILGGTAGRQVAWFTPTTTSTWGRARTTSSPRRFTSPRWTPESRSTLLPALRKLAEAFEQKAAEFADVVKAGRTHLQDAVPVTLGQEFSGYASVIRHGVVRVENTRAAPVRAARSAARRWARASTPIPTSPRGWWPSCAA